MVQSDDEREKHEPQRAQRSLIYEHFLRVTSCPSRCDFNCAITQSCICWLLGYHSGMGNERGKRGFAFVKKLGNPLRSNSRGSSGEIRIHTPSTPLRAGSSRKKRGSDGAP